MRWLGFVCFAASLGCAQAPSPLAPHLEGSIGMPHRGVLTGASELPRRGEGFRWLRESERHHGLPRFVAALERAAASVAAARPGAELVVGDLSAKSGGQLLPHLSHRTGRDADLLLYVTTLEGAPVTSPGFVHIGADGLGWDPDGQRFLRLDVEREWLLVKALVEDPEARVQWLFTSRPVESLLVEWARARGERAETILRAMDVLLQPAPPAQSHDDHVHVRTACDPSEIEAGCEPTGPSRAWLPGAAPPEPATTAELLVAILAPLAPLAPKSHAAISSDAKAAH